MPIEVRTLIKYTENIFEILNIIRRKSTCNGYHSFWATCRDTCHELEDGTVHRNPALLAGTRWHVTYGRVWGCSRRLPFDSFIPSLFIALF